VRSKQLSSFNLNKYSCVDGTFIYIYTKISNFTKKKSKFGGGGGVAPSGGSMGGRDRHDEANSRFFRNFANTPKNSYYIQGQFNNTHQLDTLHYHFHFIKTQSLDMFRASLAHPQEALHEHSFGGCSVLL
jgi:hypothetical protein